MSLEASLTKWVSSKLEDFQAFLQGVAIDGKELCGSENPETGYRTHLLSAVCHELGITLAQQPVSGKTNEIPISTQLLKAFDVAEKVVTTDALLTQRTFCKEVLEHQADYALPVKENHKQMYDDIQQLFEPLSETDATEVETRRFENLHTQEVRVDHHTHPNRKHIAHRLHQMARNRSGLSIPIAARKYKNTGDHLSDAVRHHESLTRSRIR